MKKIILALSGLAALFICLPIWFFILYTILDAIDADRLVWFLYWAYVPITLLAQGAVKLVSAVEGDET